MKGLNVKKIAALAAGALFLGSAAVTAGLTYDDTELISDSGVPQVSVIVGEDAAASDGVAAARIASFLASKAYKTTHYTADVTGEPLCTPTGGEEGGTTTGQCTDMSVTLKITSPGITGAYSWDTAIYDIFDLDPQDRDPRNDHLDGNEKDADASPLYESTNAGTTVTNDDVIMYKIDDEFTPFKDKTISIDTKDITEKQAVYIDARTTLDSDDEPYADVDAVYYSVKFYMSGDEKAGLPLCTDNKNDDWAYCEGYISASDEDTDKQVDNKRIKINFLGEDWVISKLDLGSLGGSTDLDSDDDRTTGGSITLAKEAAYGILDIGDSLETGSYRITLDDISTAVGSSNEHPAIISIYDKDTEELLKQIQVTPGSTKEVVVGEDTLNIHVYQTAPGYTLSSKWAEMAVYDHEWELTSGDEINDDNEDWTVLLYWKNKDAGTGSTYENEPDNLREIVLYDDNQFDMEEGDTKTIVDDPAKFDFTYNGLTTAEMTRVTFEITNDDEFRDCATGNYVNDNAAGTQVTFLHIKTDGDTEFEADGSTSDYDGSEIYVALDNDAEPNNAATSSTGAGDVWVRTDNGYNNCFQLDDTLAAGGSITYLYDVAGDNNLGKLTLTAVDGSGGGTAFDATGDYLTITLQEDVGEIESSDSNGYATFTFVAYGTSVSGSAADDYDFQKSSTDTDNTIEYTTTTFTPVTGGLNNVDKEVDEGFVSMRGSEVHSLSDDKYEIDIANSVRRMQFTFTTHGEEAEPNTETVVLHEGDTHTVGETTIEVVSIDGTANCGVSGTGATTCEYAGGITGVIKDEEGNTQTELTAIVPSDFSVSSLIKLDKDAMNDASFISVGGPKVNKVTARELTGANAVDFNTERVVVRQIAPGKIIVAGLTAEDTLQAADQFINELKTLQ